MNCKFAEKWALKFEMLERRLIVYAVDVSFPRPVIVVGEDVARDG